MARSKRQSSPGPLGRAIASAYGLKRTERTLAEPTVTIVLSKDKAEALSGALSDVLCWLNGFSAAYSLAKPEGYSGILGTSELRDFNCNLKHEVLKARRDAGQEVPHVDH